MSCIYRPLKAHLGEAEIKQTVAAMYQLVDDVLPLTREEYSVGIVRASARGLRFQSWLLNPTPTHTYKTATPNRYFYTSSIDLPNVNFIVFWVFLFSFCFRWSGGV